MNKDRNLKDVFTSYFIRRKIKNIFSKRNFINYMWLIAGTILTVISIEAFMIPAKLAPGGISGLANIIYNVSGYPVNQLILIMNLPLFVIGYFIMGFTFIFRTIFVTVLTTVLCEFAKFMEVGYTDSVFLNSILCGIIGGIGIGMTIRGGANTGGTDIIAIVLNYYLKFLSIGQWLLIIDGLIVLSLIFVFHDYNLMVYSLICVYAVVKSLDAILLGSNPNVLLKVCTDKNEEVRKCIYEKYGILPSVYNDHISSKTAFKMMSYIFHKKDINNVQRLIIETDNSALVMLINISDIAGLSKYREYVKDKNVPWQ